MYILIINAGSSSVKFTLFSKETVEVIAGGLVERIGIRGTTTHYRNNKGNDLSDEARVADTREAVSRIIELLTDPEYGVIQSKRQIAAIGHRVVHGGEKMKFAKLVTEKVKATIQDCYELAPLHNPPNIEGINACEVHLPNIPQVAVFDTAFHNSLPDYAYLYGLPYHLYAEDKIRRYGFHGTSHQYVCQTTAAFINVPLTELKIVSCHLGNGCSITAVNRGQSIDTSMGFTPLEGLIMGTRCGDLDPAIVFYLMKHKKLDPEKVNRLLNKQSGLLGLAGIESSDLRDIISAMAQGNTQAETAIKVFAYRIKKYIGAYTFAMGGVDAIVFTAGIGENSPLIREMACRGLEDLGIVIHPEKNAGREKICREIQDNAGKVKILVVPTDEEKAIALQVIELLATETSEQ